MVLREKAEGGRSLPAAAASAGIGVCKGGKMRGKIRKNYGCVCYKSMKTKPETGKTAVFSFFFKKFAAATALPPPASCAALCFTAYHIL